jgi:hypothetical protein
MGRHKEKSQRHLAAEHAVEVALDRLVDAALLYERHPRDDTYRAALFGRCRELRGARLAVQHFTSSNQKARRKDTDARHGLGEERRAAARRARERARNGE